MMFQSVPVVQAPALGAVPPGGAYGENWNAPLNGLPSSILRSISAMMSTEICPPLFRLCLLGPVPVPNLA